MFSEEGGIDDKYSYLDIKVTTQNKIIINIEMQLANTGEIPQRATFYSSRLVASSLMKGSSYSDYHTIAIWIFNKNVTNRKGPIHNIYLTYQPDNKNPYEILTQQKRIIFIELTKFNSQDPNINDLLKAWLSFLKNPEELSSETLNKYPTVRKAMNDLEYLKGDPEFKAQVEQRIKNMLDKSSALKTAKREGREEGREEGKKENQIETVLNMLELNLPIDVISKATKLSVEEIKKIKK